MGRLPDASSAERYCHRLREIGWQPLILRRIKAALIFAYKMIYGTVPYGKNLFRPYIPDAAAAFSVSGHTRSASALLSHPHPIQQPKHNEGPVLCGTADGSFSYVVDKIWNSLPFPAVSYFTVESFSASLEQMDWSTIPYVKEQLSIAYSNFLVQ